MLFRKGVDGGGDIEEKAEERVGAWGMFSTYYMYWITIYDK